MSHPVSIYIAGPRHAERDRWKDSYKLTSSHNIYLYRSTHKLYVVNIKKI